MLVVDSKQKKMSKKGKKGKGKKDMDDLKRELEMDEHTIPLDQLLQRLESDAQKVIRCFVALLIASTQN